jgi:hypothetical protein
VLGCNRNISRHLQFLLRAAYPVINVLLASAIFQGCELLSLPSQSSL